LIRMFIIFFFRKTLLKPLGKGFFFSSASREDIAINILDVDRLFKRTAELIKSIEWNKDE